MPKPCFRKNLFKKLSLINGLLLILEMSFGGLLFMAPTSSHEAEASVHSTMCGQAVDVVLLMDRSGSMDYTSVCTWWQLKCINSPSCSLGYKWVNNTTYNLTQAQCNAKNQSAPHQSSFLAITPKKIIAAKQAADNFVGLMGTGDQSGLVSYADSATLDKQLSNNHATTQTAINNLVANGATDMGDAMKLANVELLSVRSNPQANKVMILLTDGMANKPNGPGFGEYPADVAYALTQAGTAASSSIKIFTIGLGSAGEIDETMLQTIASTTGGQYFHAPTQNDLQAIYNSIATRLCRFGSISGCKYSDANKDGSIIGEQKLSGWPIVLQNDITHTQLTDQTGCFKFTGLLPGPYTLSENGKPGVSFLQTYPTSNFYAINLAEGANLENYDFGNYLPVCGNHILDSAYGEVCELGDTQTCTTTPGYKGVKSCLANCSGWNQCIPSEFCGDGIKNGNEQCDGADGATPNQACNANCTINNSPVCGDGIVNGQEECDDANTNNYDGCKNDCTLPGCKSNMDVMIVLDRSGSMGYNSACDWWQLKCINRPTCSLGYAWVENLTYNQTQAQCAAKNQSAPHQSVWTQYNPVKITAAKAAADNFLTLLGTKDQSALVSYADSATLDKFLSNNHALTQTAINNIITGGATDIGDAIKLGTGELISVRGNPDAHKVIILLTDGMANKPSGPGFGEYPADVAYALTQAGIASSDDIKIFTIGLGSDGDINETMLQSIATSSGGLYYNDPTAQDLTNIFNSLKGDVCPNPGVCGNGLKEVGEQCDVTDGVGLHQTCSPTCTLINQPFCGDGIKNGTEQCDGTAGVGPHQSCTADCTITNLPYCGDGIINQPSEKCDDGNTNNTDACKNDCTINLCQSDLDVMMVLDRSGSMGYTSKCDWWQLKCINPPSCSSGYAWVENITFNQNQAWCTAKNQTAPHQAVWTGYSPVKLAAAKAAADGFLNLLVANDQSGLVSYADSATLDKLLSNNHTATQASINSLVASGATDIGDAINLGTLELTSGRAKPLAAKVIILLTDGMANKPYGSGSGENPFDVAYALAQAGIATTDGIKIFTIGLGDEIDALMLGQIATLSGGQYYFAPTTSQLQTIFNQISTGFCQQ